MTELLERWLTSAVLTVGRALPAERRDRLTAMAVEAETVSAGPSRLGWLVGMLPLLIQEVGRMRPYGTPRSSVQ